MGFFDSIANSSIAQTVQTVAAKVQTVEDFMADQKSPSLVSIGVAAAGNLTPAQIAAGVKGAPPQPTVVPSSVPASAIANANPLARISTATGLSMGMMAVIAVGAYFIFFKKRG